MILRRRLFLTVASILISAEAGAGDSTYLCRATRVQHLDTHGSLERTTELEKLVAAHPFSVSRRTGALQGKSLSLDTSRAVATRVIAYGSAQNAFEATADFGRFENDSHPFQFIKIEEFRAEEEKPFILVGEIGIVSGTCK